MITGEIQRLAVPAATEINMLGSSTKRVLIIISTDTAGPIYFRNEKLGAVAGGLNIVNTSGVYEFPIWKYGDLVFKEWWVYNPGATTVNVGFVEIID